MINYMQKNLDKLIKKEGLDKDDIFLANYSTFEEIPIFSRWDNISFLSELDFNDKNKILIKKAIEVINNILGKVSEYLNGEDEKQFFICLTITDWDDYKDIQCLTPNIFISKKKDWILSFLDLKQKSTIEEYLIREYLSSLTINEYDVFMTSIDDPENKRIYVLNKSH